jgi:hypothetical protein
VETIQQFIDGVIDGHRKSGPLSKKFLKGPRFQPDFGTDETRGSFYSDIRCGLLHQAEAKNKWLIRRKQAELLKKVGTNGYIIDVERFHAAVKDSLEDYLTELCKPESADLRTNLWTKMSHICDVRTARGAMYGTQSPGHQAPCQVDVESLCPGSVTSVSFRIDPAKRRSGNWY